MTQQTVAQERKKAFTHHNLDIQNIQTRIENDEKLFVTAFASRPRRIVDGEARKGTAFKIHANGDFARKLRAIAEKFGTDEKGVIQKKLNVYGVYEKADEWNGKKTDVVTIFDVYEPEARAAERAAVDEARTNQVESDIVKSMSMAWRYHIPDLFTKEEWLAWNQEWKRLHKERCETIREKRQLLKQAQRDLDNDAPVQPRYSWVGDCSWWSHEDTIAERYSDLAGSISEIQAMHDARKYMKDRHQKRLPDIIEKNKKSN